MRFRLVSGKFVRSSVDMPGNKAKWTGSSPFIEHSKNIAVDQVQQAVFCLARWIES
jgi:hypothetical protein